MQMKLSQEQGFTLVELMIAVAIIAILAAIAIPNFISYREKAQAAQAIHELEMIKYAIWELALDTNMYPNNIPAEGIGSSSELADLSDPDAGLVATNGDFPGWAGPYLDEIPKDPWGRDYFFDPDYGIDGVKYVVIGSFGPNGSGMNDYDEDNIYIIISNVASD